MASSAAPNKKREYWIKEEDRILREYIELNGPEKWDQVSKYTGLCEAGKTGNSCRLRWVNHLDPKINKGPFTAEEVDKIIFLRNITYEGQNRWSKIAEHLPGRNDNQVKNCWHTHKLWERPLINEESIRNLFEKVFLHEPMISEPDVNQRPFEESTNTDQDFLFDYINANDFNQLPDLLYTN